MTMILVGILFFAAPSSAQYIPTKVDSYKDVDQELQRASIRIQKQSLLLGGTVYGDLAIADRLETADTYTDTLSVRQMYGKGASGITISSPTTTTSTATFSATGANPSVAFSSSFLLGNVAGPSTNGAMSYAQTGNTLYVSSLPITMGGWVNYTPTFGGFGTPPPTVVARYARVGNQVSVFVSALGASVSNATSFTITLPITPAQATAGPIKFDDNGAVSATPGMIVTTAGNTTANLYTTWATGAWTAANAKRAIFNLTYEAQ